MRLTRAGTNPYPRVAAVLGGIPEPEAAARGAIEADRRLNRLERCPGALRDRLRAVVDRLRVLELMDCDDLVAPGVSAVGR